MKNITITNWKGNEYSGDWNEKVYTSKIDGENALIRIYVDNNAIHITKEELERIQNKIITDNKEKTCAISSLEERRIINFMATVDPQYFELIKKCLKEREER